MNTTPLKLRSINEEPIECRAAVELSPIARNELLFLPIGLHAITPVAGGIGRPIKVKVDPTSADVMEKQRAILAGKGKRPYFDFNHEDGPASFWPESFRWKPGEGVVASGEWSARGRKAVEGKDYRAFSPVFHVDNKRSDPAKVICKEHADPNMGGLVNNPAFNNLPLWAKNAGASGASTSSYAKASEDLTEKENKMNTEEIAALRAKDQELETMIDRLSAMADDDNSKAELSAARSQKTAIELRIENAELKARDEAKSIVIRKRAQDDAKSAVKAAVKRGAILARDTKTQQEWEARLVADQGMLALLSSLPGHGGALETSVISSSGSRVTITDEEPARIFGAIASKIAVSRRTSSYQDRMALSKEIAGIYAREMSLSVVRAGSAHAERVLSFPVQDLQSAIEAADVTDADLGTLSGTLVTQRVLELLKIEFPPLGMFTTDFSDQPAQFNQTIMTRTMEIPSVVTYSTSTGWPTSTYGTNDVPVTIDKHHGVQITFNEQMLASTVRRLFDEQAPASAYALAKDMVDALYVNITDANFTNNTVKATSSFARADVIAIGVDMDIRGVPLQNRTLLLYPTVFGKLKQDTAVINPGIYAFPEILTESRTGVKMVVPIDSFQVCSAPNLPTNNGNITGFACTKSALVIATRVPNDYTTSLSGASYGSVQLVTNPDIGITVMLAQYVDHQLGTGNSRIALMYGTAAGQGAAGQLLKAASGSGSSRA